jgi:plasmid rolling circle replication initiator protein Rep
MEKKRNSISDLQAWLAKRKEAKRRKKTLNKETRKEYNELIFHSVLEMVPSHKISF